MLSEIFHPFVKESPISLMVGGLLARVFCPDEIDHLFEVNAQRQDTKDLLFSTLFDLMSKVVCGIRPSVHAAYQATSEEIAVSITSVYKGARQFVPLASLIRTVLYCSESNVPPNKPGSCHAQPTL